MKNVLNGFSDCEDVPNPGLNFEFAELLIKHANFYPTGSILTILLRDLQYNT